MMKPRAAGAWILKALVASIHPMLDSSLIVMSRRRRSRLKLKMEIGDIPVLTLPFYGY